MLLYAHGHHRYYDAGRHQERIFNPGEVAEVDDGLGGTLLLAHPAKFCDVTDSQVPGEHACDKPVVPHEYATTVIMRSPNTALMPRLSPQRRQLLKKAQKRSRRARLATRG